MNAPAVQTQNPDYNEAADCLMSLYDATAKAVSTMARGTRSKADRFEIAGIVMLTTFLAKSACVDLDGAFDASVEEGEPDPRRASRALLVLNERLLKGISCLMLARSKTTAEARELLIGEAFERFQIRNVYACAMAFANASGVKGETWEHVAEGLGIDQKSDAYSRGFEDADKGRPALFFERRGEFWTHSDDPGADDWDQQARADYMRGYEDSEAADGIR